MDKLGRFKEKAKRKHADKYLYDDVIYISSKEKVEITCKKHGSFFLRPDAHIRGVGCSKCSGGVKYDTQLFIEKCKEIRGDDYLLDRVEYFKSNTKVIIGCKKHGYFEIRPANFLSGQGCSKCGGVWRKSNADFILESKRVHGQLYDYSFCEYVNNRKKVKIICQKHGQFEQNPKDHLSGVGCPNCKSSKGEIKIQNLLHLLGINFERNKKFVNCVGTNGGSLPFDFHISSKNLLIEYDGRQHLQPVEKFGGVEIYKRQIINDEIRNKWCLTNGIKLIRISYKDSDDKLIKLLSKLWNYDFSSYLKSYNELLDWLRSLDENLIVDFREDQLSCDFFLKTRGIAIRLIGFWKNCDKNQNKKHNINLKEEFHSKNINLINIFEDSWVNKKEIIKSRIFYCAKNSNKIMARKCHIKYIEGHQCRQFLQENHLQGFVGSKVKLGLFHGDQLVSVMTFGSLRINMGSSSKEDAYELLRFCNLKDWTVVGAASKLFNFFIKNHNPQSIISYADLSWTDLSSNVYDKIGLKKVSLSNPSYYYIDEVGKKNNRFLFRKDVLVKRGHEASKTEFEICDSLGLLRVYDTGTLKYEWKKED